MLASKLSSTLRQQSLKRIIITPILGYYNNNNITSSKSYSTTNYVSSSSSTTSSSSSSNTTANVIINAVGADRLGIVSDVSKVVIDCGGNVGESVAGRLGNHFSLMMLISIPNNQLSVLQQQVLQISDIEAAVFNAGTNVSAAGSTPSTTPSGTPLIGYSGKFTLEGADHPGIVHRVTTALAKNSLNIDQLQTEQELAPYGGAVLFKMRGIVVATAPLAKQFDINKIKNELRDLGDTLNCDLTLEDIVDEQFEGSFYAG